MSDSRRECHSRSAIAGRAPTSGVLQDGAAVGLEAERTWNLITYAAAEREPRGEGGRGRIYSIGVA